MLRKGVGMLVVALLLPTVSHAADPALIAALLPDEASECRYLLMLCEEAHAVAVDLEQQAAQLQQKQQALTVPEKTQPPSEPEKAEAEPPAESGRAATQELGIKSTRDEYGVVHYTNDALKPQGGPTRVYVKAREEVEQLAREHTAALTAYTAKRQETLEVAKVIRVKHDTMPTCFQQCKGLDVKKLR